MKCKVFFAAEVGIKKNMHMSLQIFNEAEGRNRTSLQPKVFLKSWCRCKTNFTLMQMFFKIVNIQWLIVPQNNKIVPVSFVVSKKEILAKHGVQPRPIF